MATQQQAVKTQKQAMVFIRIFLLAALIGILLSSPGASPHPCSWPDCQSGGDRPRLTRRRRRNCPLPDRGKCSCAAGKSG